MAGIGRLRGGPANACNVKREVELKAACSVKRVTHDRHALLEAGTQFENLQSQAEAGTGGRRRSAVESSHKFSKMRCKSITNDRFKLQQLDRSRLG
jgi:hypothetical protein